MKAITKIGLSFLGMISMGTYAQEFDINLQLRPRYEYRNGFGSPINDKTGEIPGSFISQRSRLNFNFKQDKLKTKLTLQNVRVWGDMIITPSAYTNGIGLFEAWAQYDFNANWSTRIGRQVISYDNQRIFGEIDWAQQAQSHDAAMITFKKQKSQLDFTAAFNAQGQNNLTPQPISYNVSTYRNMQFAWYHNQMEKLGVSLLALNTGYDFPNAPVTPPVESKTYYKQTFGTYLTYKAGKLTGDLGLYAQTGKNNNKDVSAFYGGFNLGYAVSDKFSAGLGFEHLSGTAQDDTSGKNKSFSPLFGTNHAFNGHMDYFYVGNYQNTVGLNDAYLKFNYTHNKWNFLLMPHYFAAAATVLDANGAKMDNYLGTEIDFNASYAVQKDITVSGGYSQMFGTSTMERVKGANTDITNNWAWVMISFNPRLFSIK
ncbi:MAG: hypothetical protein ACI7YS_08185 [Flavobacterium sp.]